MGRELADLRAEKGGDMAEVVDAPFRLANPHKISV